MRAADVLPISVRRIRFPVRRIRFIVLTCRIQTDYLLANWIRLESLTYRALERENLWLSSIGGENVFSCPFKRWVEDGGGLKRTGPSFGLSPVYRVKLIARQVNKKDRCAMNRKHIAE